MRVCYIRVMEIESFEQMLTGGHHNSLGRTLEVVDAILAHPEKLEELYNCYFSEDAVVRLRTSSAMKRITQAHPQWVVPYLDRLISVIAKIDQASTQWTLANLFDFLTLYMTDAQKSDARAIMMHNVATHNDWIVLNTTMPVLADWAKAGDSELAQWLIPQLERHAQDKRKSVAKRASKQLSRFAAN